MGKGLAVKQRRFADAYLGTCNGNGYAAAEAVGYHPDHASDLLKSPVVRAYIDARLEAETAPSRLVLRELTRVGFADFAEYVTVKMRDGKILDVKMDLASKVKALELLGKYYQLWDEHPSVQVSVTVQTLAERIAERHNVPIEAVYRHAESLLESST